MWLNTHLRRPSIISLEDPAEDVFITNLQTPHGDYAIFQGIWESNDYYLQAALDTLLELETSESQDVLSACFALLRLSSAVIDRLPLERWHIEDSYPRATISISHATRLDERSRAVMFTERELAQLGIPRDHLEPFVLADRRGLLGQSLDDSALTQHPLLQTDVGLVLALPSAVSVAIRRLIVRRLRRSGDLSLFERTLCENQAHDLVHRGLLELKRSAVSLPPPPPPAQGQPPSLHSWLLKYDTDKYIHIILLHDRLESIDDRGLSAPLTYPDHARKGLDAYLHFVATHVPRSPERHHGLTLIVFGGLGRGVAVGLRAELPSDWDVATISLPDLLLLASDLSDPVKRFLKCMRHKTWAEQQGVAFRIPNGDFNLYSFWRRNNYQLIPRAFAVAEGSLISLGPEFVRFTRDRVRALVDAHTIPTTNGSFARVVRFGMDAYFESTQQLPVYTSLTHIASRQLAGAVETKRGVSWFTVTHFEGDDRYRDIAYQLWADFLPLYQRVVRAVEAAASHLASGPLEVRLDLRHIGIPAGDEIRNMPEGYRGIDLDVNIPHNTVTLNCPTAFLANFRRPENEGERVTIAAMAKALAHLHLGIAQDFSGEWLDPIVNQVVTPDLRVFHIFPTQDAADYLLNRRRQHDEDVSLAQDEFVLAKMGLAYGCTEARPGTTLRSKDECNALLKNIVTKLWDRLRDTLRGLNRAATLRSALNIHESIIRDREHWRRTARALIALHQQTDDVYAVARGRETERNNLALPARVVLEMALCECDPDGGRAPSGWDLESLLATAAVLIEVATDSDAIHSDLLTPAVTLWANGEYTLDRGFYEAVVQPFHTAHFEEGFSDAADAYERLYREQIAIPRRTLQESVSARFVDAFTGEFGLTPDEAIQAVGALMDIAVERDAVVVETSVAEIKRRLAERGLTADASKAFLNNFGLHHRPHWDRPPKGFTHRDISPWRYSRRLSVTARPILVLGADADSAIAVYGLGTLRQSIGHVLDRTERGQMPAEFFVTDKMRTYLGAVSHERGHVFAESVAEGMRADGWEVRTSVKMTELGGLPELGDIDVLAWNGTGAIRLVECKRIQLARTVAEIAEICRRFRGEAKDELAKHIRRTNWVKDNPARLARIVGTSVDTAQIDALVVTNTHVPMRYLESLPIAASKIGPLRHRSANTAVR